MLKRLLPIVPLVFAACMCGKKDFGEKLSLSLPPVADGEFATFRVMANGDSIGTMSTLFAFDYLRDIPAYVQVIITRTRAGNVETVDSSVVYMGRNHLNPLSSFRFIRKGENLVTAAANYGEKSIAVSTYGMQGEKQRLLPFDAKTYDTDQLTLIGRALKPEPGKPARLNIASSMGPPAGGTVMGGEFEFLGDEVVTVPAGTFDCRRLGLTVGESQVELWYERSGTGKLVRYRSPQVSMELLPSAPGEAILTRKEQVE